ncbi:MAG: translation initiation factor IF-2, partial [Lachnospiraceae bacterium]|nr:translation initiation factor IF-2 [Lachnospiraceae bacterium]
EDILFEDPEDQEMDESYVERPPVVVVMGHVDHGKTSLLDAIRSTSVTSGEAGGITQHIGAYMVRINDRKINFLDTPGHEAFTSMRARGAQVTDVAIIVVAADDGVKPQTVEAINHAKAANVSIVVAVNKIDKQGVNIDKVMTEMAEHEIVPEEWGGDVPFVPVSAKTGENIELLLETVLLCADVLELKASPTKQAKGTIIEAKLDKNIGPVATLLVQRGTLKMGDAIISGTSFGHVRTMTDDKGNSIKKATPSTPVEITGLQEVPVAGEVFYAIKDEKVAKHLAEQRKSQMRENTIRAQAKVSLDDLFNQIQAGDVKDLNIIVKADVVGSVEAVKQSLQKLTTSEVKVNIIHGAVGSVTESDIQLASVSNAIIIGFNVRPAANITESAKDAGVDIRLYSVIYDAIEDVKAAMIGMLDPEYKESVTGHIEVRQTFKVSGVGTIAGGYVTDGKVLRNSDVRIVRDGIVVYQGKLASLKRFKDDVKEVAQGFECGLSFENYNDIKEGDVVEAYIMEEVKRNG